MIRTHTSSNRPGVLVVQAPEAIDHETADPLRLAVARDLPEVDRPAAILDAAAVRLLTSLGVATLLQIEELCRTRTGVFIIAALPDAQVDLLRMLRLEHKFRFAPTLDAAVAAIDEP